MRRKNIAALLMIVFALPAFVLADKPGNVAGGESERAGQRQDVIWREPRDITTRNLFYGPGGKAGQPRGPFRFIEEDRGGSSPKFILKDARGVLWKAKLGKEAKSETAATRMLWAVGYFADVNYFLPRMRVAGLPKLRRGQEYVLTDGTVTEARLERVVKKMGDWSWFDNPFTGTRELDGLRVMMAFMNGWDLKQSNNAIYEFQGERRYVVNDVGDTFGKTGTDFSRSRGNLNDYLESELIDEVAPETVDLVLRSRPPMYFAVAVPYYIKRARMEKIAQGIPRAHARWIGQWLNRLSDKQISDAFRAAGFPPHEVNAYTGKVRERIGQLNDL